MVKSMKDQSTEKLETKIYTLLFQKLLMNTILCHGQCGQVQVQSLEITLETSRLLQRIQNVL